MTHLDDGAVQAWIHGEGGSARGDLERHLIDCTACRAMVAAAEAEDRWTLQQLSLLDATPRDRSTARAEARRQASAIWRRAAAVVLVAGIAGVAYALPAVRVWWARVSAPEAPSSGRQEPVSRDSGAAAPPVDAAPGGIAVVPGGRFAVVVTGAGSPEVRLRALSRNDLSVSAAGGDAVFESREGAITVRAVEGARIDIEVPLGAPFVTVTVNGRLVAEVRSGMIHATDRPAAPLEVGGWIELTR